MIMANRAGWISIQTLSSRDSPSQPSEVIIMIIDNMLKRSMMMALHYPHRHRHCHTSTALAIANVLISSYSSVLPVFYIACAKYTERTPLVGMVKKWT
jgi:hypothetical protein